MTLDATARRAASKLIGQFGRVISLTTVTAGAYDTATGAAANTTASVSVKAVIEDFNGYEIASGLALQGDKKVTVSAADLAAAPKPVDTLTIDGFVFTIVGVKAVSSGALDALYIIQARLT
jgi:hypothetical protein